MKTFRPALTAITAAAMFLLVPAGSAQADRPAPSESHGQCVSSSPQPSGPGGRSGVAKDKGGCPAPLTCVENEDDPDTVSVNSAANTVTIKGSGPDSAGSALQCDANIAVTAGDTISVDYVFGAETAPCGGGVPRMYVIIDGTVYNTFDDNPTTCEATSSSLVLEVSGTVTEIGVVYDRGDDGSVTYSNAMVGDVVVDF